MKLLNGPQAVGNVAKICGISCVIGHGDISKTVKSLKDEDYQPELLDLHGDSAVSAAIGRTLAGQRCLTDDAELKDLALAHIPTVCIAPGPKNWSIVFAPSTVQEVIDDSIIAYALAERSFLPATVVIDKTFAETFETAELPPEKMIKNFLGELKLDKNHAKLARQDLEGYAQAQKSTDLAIANLPKLSLEWKKRFRRTIEPFETFMLEDAELALIVYGPSSSNAKLAVQTLRQQGEKVGLLRLHILRPWYEQELQSALQNVSRIAVIDRQISLGTWSKLYQGIKTWYNGFASNFIARDLLTVQEFTDIAHRLRAASAPERVWMM